MMNLLIGILSEKLGDIVTNKTVSNFRLLLQACIDHESSKALFFCKIGEATSRNLCYATSERATQEWEGQVNTIKEIVKISEKKVLKEFKLRTDSMLNEF